MQKPEKWNPAQYFAIPPKVSICGPAPNGQSAPSARICKGRFVNRWEAPLLAVWGFTYEKVVEKAGRRRGPGGCILTRPSTTADRCGEKESSSVEPRSTGGSASDRKIMMPLCANGAKPPRRRRMPALPKLGPLFNGK